MKKQLVDPLVQEAILKKVQEESLKEWATTQEEAILPQYEPIRSDCLPSKAGVWGFISSVMP